MKKMIIAGLALISLTACTSTPTAPQQISSDQICILRNPLVYQAKFDQRILQAYQKLNIPARIVNKLDKTCQTVLTYTAKIDRGNNLVYRAHLELVRKDTKLSDVTYRYESEFDNIQDQIDYMVQATLYLIVP